MQNVDPLSSESRSPTSRLGVVEMVMGTICQGSIPCFQTRDPEMADGEGVARRADSLRINKQINEDIKLEKKKLRNTYKILLLGCGEAGKVDCSYPDTPLAIILVFSVNIHQANEDYSLWRGRRRMVR